MTRLAALVVVATVLSGCAQPGKPGSVDPFFGPTRVEPPHTGGISVPAGVDPYYQGAQPGILPNSGPVAPLGGPAPVSGSPASLPPGVPSVGTAAPANPVNPGWSAGSPSPGDRISIPLSSRQGPDPRTLLASRSNSVGWSSSPTSPSTTSTPPVATPGLVPVPVVSQEKTVQTIQPRTPASPASTQSLPPPPAVALPPAQTAPSTPPAGSTALPPPPATSDIRSSSGAVANVVVPASATGAPASSCYAFDRCYRWLRGRLDYSQDGRWRLRYLPVGTTDAYGGSVVLASTPLLSGLRPGNFVEVRGQVNCATVRPGFSPEYIPVEIKRLAP